VLSSTILWRPYHRLTFLPNYVCSLFESVYGRCPLTQQLGPSQGPFFLVLVFGSMRQMIDKSRR